MSDDKQDNTSVEIPTPIGLFKANGANTIVIIILVFSLGLFAYVLKSHIDTSTRFVDELKKITYVLTLSDDERRSLKLTMPESLRQDYRR